MANPAPNLPLMRAKSGCGPDEAAMVQYRRDGEVRARATMKDYNLLDLGI